MSYVVKINIFDYKNNLLNSIDNKKGINILIDETIFDLVNKIVYILNDPTLSIKNVFLFNDLRFDIQYKTNISTSNIIQHIVNNDFIYNKGNKYNETLLNVFGVNNELSIKILTIKDIISQLKSYKLIDDNTLFDIFNKYIINYFPEYNFDEFSQLFKENILPDNEDNYEQILIDQEEINLIEFDNDNMITYLSEAKITNAFIIIKTNFLIDDTNNEKITYEFSNQIIVQDIFLKLFEEIDIDNIISSVIFINKSYTLTKSIESVTTINEPNKSKYIKLKISGNLNGNKFNLDINLDYIKLIATFVEDKKIEDFINEIINLISKKNTFIKLKYESYSIDFFNVRYKFLREFDFIKLFTTIKNFKKYFLVYKEDKDKFIIKYKLSPSNKKIELQLKLYNILKDNNNYIFTNVILNKYIQDYQIDKDNLLEEIDNIKTMINNRTKINLQEKTIIKLSKTYIDVFGLKSFFDVKRIYYILNKICNIEFNSIETKEKVTVDKKKEKYLKFVTFLDKSSKKITHKKRTKYWTRMCQNFGKKYRVPIMIEENEIDLGRLIEKKVSSDQTLRIFIDKVTNQKYIKITLDNESLYFTCNNSKENETPFIGFTNTCSLCCFKKDQLIDMKKLKICWLNEIDENIKLYKKSRVIGQLTLLNETFNILFDNNYLFFLESIGQLNYKMKHGDLLFIDNELVNPHYFKNKFRIWIYDYPYYFKLVYKENNEIIDTFESTPINDFILKSQIKFNSIYPFNFINIYNFISNIMESYTFIEQSQYIIFHLQNNLTLMIKDFSNKFFYNKSIFDEKHIHRYISNIKINEFNEKEIISFLKLNSLFKPNYILMNKNNNIIGISIGKMINFIFKPIGNDKKSIIFEGLDKYFDIEINIYLEKSIENISIVDYILTDENIKENYFYNIFRLYFNIFLKTKKNILDNILKIINEKEDKTKKFNKIKNYIFDNFNNNVFDKYIKKSIDKFSFNNNLLLQELILTNETLEKYLYRISNELMYNFSSIYIYVSRFIDNTFSQYDESEIIIPYTTELNIKNEILGIEKNNIIYQEIYNLDFLAIYRALANIYYWIKFKENLGYYNQTQTNISFFIKSIINEDLDAEKIITKFNEIYKYNIQFILNEIDLQIHDKNKESIGFIYIIAKDILIQQISVGLIKV